MKAVAVLKFVVGGTANAWLALVPDSSTKVDKASLDGFMIQDLCFTSKTKQITPIIVCALEFVFLVTVLYSLDRQTGFIPS